MGPQHTDLEELLCLMLQIKPTSPHAIVIQVEGKTRKKRKATSTNFYRIEDKGKEGKHETSRAQRERSSFDAFYQRLGEALHGQP